MKKALFRFLSGYPVFCLAVLLFLTACAQNKPSLPTPDGSQPNEYSAYLFSAGNVLYYNGDFFNADNVFRMALRYDPNSLKIKKALFETQLRRVEYSDISLIDFKAFVDSLLIQKAMDKIMLEQAYNIFAKSNDNQNAKYILDIYLKKHKSARAYTSLFYLEQALYGKSRKELLDRAYKLAGNDAPFLNSLGYLYMAFDSVKAEKIWQNNRKNDTTNQAAQFLWELYSRQNNSEKLHKLWNSFRLPDEKDKLLAIINSSFDKVEFRSIVTIGDALLATDDAKFLLPLMQASWYTHDDVIFEQCWNQLQPKQLNKPDTQLTYFYAALYYLRKEDYAEALSWLSRLNGKDTLDEFILVYRAYSLINSTEFLSIDEVKNRLKKTIEPAHEAQLAIPVKNYLLAVTENLTEYNEISIPDSIAQDCVEWFYNNKRHTYDTYFWLAQYYSKTKQDSLMKSLLREALDEYSNDATLLNWLGYSYVLTEDNLDEAEILIRRALQLSPENPYYLDSLGWLYYLKGDIQQAVALMEIPSRLEKMPSEIAFHLGTIYNAAKDKEKAIHFLKLAIDVNDDAGAVAKAQALLETIQ